MTGGVTRRQCARADLALVRLAHRSVRDYGRNVVFLLRYLDHDLCARLAANSACDVKLSGMTCPWPDRPLFLPDLIPQQRIA
jgi:hypothetical protein